MLATGRQPQYIAAWPLTAHSMTHIKTLSAGSILIGVVVLALKYAAYALTATVALLSDAIESIVTRVWEGGGQARGPDIFWT
jgi:hypothetical protein